MATTTTAEPTLPQINFVPEENAAALLADIAAWILANGFMGMTDHTRASLESGRMGSLDFGGTVSLPDGTKIGAHAILSVDLYPNFIVDLVEDPEGTRWSRDRFEIKVHTPGYGLQTAAQARARFSIFEAVIVLAERLEQYIASAVLWRRGSTRVEREAAAAAQRKVDMQRLVAGALALECAGMRKGSEKMAVTPPGVDKGTYDVEHADKTYRAYVTSDRRFNFVRLT